MKESFDSRFGACSVSKICYMLIFLRHGVLVDCIGKSQKVLHNMIGFSSFFIFVWCGVIHCI